MGKDSNDGKWTIIGVIVAIIGVIFTILMWQDGRSPGPQDVQAETEDPANTLEIPRLESEPSPEKDLPDSGPKSEEGLPESEVGKNPQFSAQIQVSRGRPHSRQEYGSAWKFEEISQVEVTKPGEGDQGAGIELVVVGAGPCRVILAPGDVGACGEYEIELIELNATTATLKIKDGSA